MAKHNIWTEPETKLLKSWVGKKPLKQIQEEWNAIARRRGWLERSSFGIEVKLKRLCKGRGIATDRDGWSIKSLARALDITHTRVIKWQQKGLEVRGYSHDAHGRPHITCITRAALKLFALAHPEHFADIDPSRLSRAFKDSKYTKLCQAAPSLPGRAIAVLRLDSGEVYWSAAAAGNDVNIASTVILQCCDRDTSMKNGMDWARLDYPPYIISRAVRDEFNLYAAKALYELYLQLREVSGYSKTSCLIVAGRIAVQITLWAFNRQIKERKKGLKLSPKQAIIDYWQQRWIEGIQTFLPLEPQQAWRRVFDCAKYRAYSAFAPFLKYDRGLLTRYLEEFAMWWIDCQTKRYINKGYLPKNYQPKTQLERADLFAFIYSTNIAKVEIKEDTYLPIIILKAWQYIDRKTSLCKTVDVDLSGIEPNEFNSLQHAANQKLIQQTNDSQQELDNFIEFIQKFVISKEYEILKLYLDLKLEECSDREIQSAMHIDSEGILKIEQKIKYLASRYATI